MGETFTPEEITGLNDLRRRIANDGEYNEEELQTAFQLFRTKREEASQPKEKKTTTRAKKKDVDLSNLL